MRRSVFNRHVVSRARVVGEKYVWGNVGSDPRRAPRQNFALWRKCRAKSSGAVSGGWKSPAVSGEVGPGISTFFSTPSRESCRPHDNRRRHCRRRGLRMGAFPRLIEKRRYGYFSRALMTDLYKPSTYVPFSRRWSNLTLESSATGIEMINTLLVHYSRFSFEW